MKILIAEDDPIMLETIKEQLKKDEYVVLGTNDGREALQALDNFKPDLIITDILMPYTSGLELIGIIRSEKDEKVPILVLSALDEEATVLEAFSMGANDFLSKPFNPAEFNIRVKRLLTIGQKNKG
ncbi:MAG TPA: response regulator transcription factor [Chitinophagaceae bacterium]|nr:response regulator transcription factor [Chitinophagaceae bacterium]